MAFGDNIADLGTQVAPDNSGGSCNLAITIPANSCCLVFGLVGQSTFGSTNADISDSESLTWTPIKDGTDKLAIEGADTIGKGIFAWMTNNTTGSSISTTVTLTRGSPGTNAAGRSFALSALSFDGEGDIATNYATDTDANGDPSATFPSSLTSPSVSVAVYYSSGNSAITATPADLPRVSLFATLNAPPLLRQSDLRAELDWVNTTAAWQTNDLGSVEFLFEIEDVGGATTISLSPASAQYTGQSVTIPNEVSIPIGEGSFDYSGENLTLTKELRIYMDFADPQYIGQIVDLDFIRYLPITNASIDYAPEQVDIIQNRKVQISPASVEYAPSYFDIIGPMTDTNRKFGGLSITLALRL